MRTIRGAILGVLPVAAFILTFAVTPSSTAQAGPSSVGWAQSDGSGSAGRANQGETTLTRNSISAAGYLRSVLAAPITAPDSCATGGIAQPVLTGGRLYAISGGLLTAFNPATGAVVWRAEPYQGFDVNVRALAVSHGTVILGEVDCDSQSDQAGYVEGYSAVDGGIEWRQSASSALASMIVSGDYVVETGTSVGSGQGTSVFRVSSGARVWTETGEYCVAAGVVVVAGLVIHAQCSPDGGIGSLEADRLATGAVVWSRSGAFQVQRGDSDTSAGRHVYVTLGATVYDLNPANGARRHTLVGAENVLAVDGTQAYATCGDVQICAYEEATGAHTWAATVSEPSTLAAEAHGLLYLGSGLVLNSSTGKPVATLAVANPTATTALIVGDGRVAIVNEPRVLDLYGLAGY